jgi:glucose/arabinose dehydrogenase
MALVGTACPGDDTTGTGTESATGTSTGPGTADSTNGPSTVTMGTSMSTTEPGTTTTPEDTTATTEPTGTTGEPIDCPYDEVPGTPSFALQMVGQGFNRPLLALGHPTEPDRLFVLEQNGNVRILEPGETMAPAEAFLHVDVAGAGATSIGAEFGLLGFAFHPDFPADPRVYVDYNPAGGGDLHTVVSEFTLDPANPNQVDPASERVVIELHQPDSNHNGGMLLFDSDGYLIIGMGDGGGSGDTYDTGRNTSVLMSKILRIGVEPDGNPDDPMACDGCPQYGPFDYTIPADNPFVGDPAFAPEIYAWGLRNPWRMAIDPETDLMYVGDVGQGDWEEITLADRGADLGWSDMEGFHCFGGAGCDEGAGPNQVNADGMTMPLVEYEHTGGRCSVTGGAVYRSCEVPAWQGVYFYSDFCTGEHFGLVWDGNTATDLGLLLDHNQLPLGNGWNAYGDVFITTVDAILGGPIFDGLVYRVAPGV